MRHTLLPFVAVVAVVAVVAAGPAAAAPPDVPAGLPKYHVDLDIAPQNQLATFRVRATWTNRRKRPTDKLVFHFYPNYRVPPGESLKLAKTLEVLRVSPSSSIPDTQDGNRIDRVALADGPADIGLNYTFRGDRPTVLTVDLPHAVGPGESVTVELAGSVRLPEKQWRWGQWDGTAYLTHALPTLAYYDDGGWKDAPFVPWHQPFHNEAGEYAAAVTVPADHLVGCSARVRAEADLGDGRKRLTFAAFVGRDFAVTCSPKYAEFTSSVTLPGGKEVALRCLAFPRHEFYAREVLKIVGEALPAYSKWLGDFPYDQFTVAESHFGWLGNECSGMILIDARVFGMPHLARGYVEYLVSHETCHQWWYNLIGTNGYSETWVDEGAATYFTHRLLDRKRGQNNDMVYWPNGLQWLPNIRRENYRWASWYAAIRRDDMQAAAGDLPTFGHLYGLFTGAYDRGSKVYGMVEARLGDAAFLEFARGLAAKYRFEVLSGADFRRELEEFTGRPWGDFFDKWVHGKGLTDWQLGSVTSSPAAGGGTRVEVTVRQSGEIDEPTAVGFQLAPGDGFPVRVPVGPVTETARVPGLDAEVEPAGPGTVVVRVTLPSPPTQVTIDPDGVLPDADPSNNRWQSPPTVTVTPLYTMLDETDLTTDWDRWNGTIGPWFGGAMYPDPWYTRSGMAGVRAGAFRTQTFAGGAYAAFRSDYRDLVVGADGVVDHWPHPRTQVGFNVERRVGGPYSGNRGEDTAFRAAVWGRYALQYGGSLYLPPTAYVDAFASYQDNFLPFARTPAPGGVRPGYTQLTGLHYRLNLLTPYWDPERGVWVDLTAAGGVADLAGVDRGMVQGRAELATAQKLPDGLGYWSDVKLAGRVVVQAAAPDEGLFFALGGGTLFRGFDLTDRQGSFLWVVNQEVRVPVFRRVEWDAADHVIGVRNVYAAGFVDAGEVYAAGRSVGGVAYAVGAGLRADLAVFSFIERATVRLDVGKAVNAARPWQVWFGVQHPF